MDEINSLDKKFKDTLNLMKINESSESFLTSVDPHFNFNSDLIDIFKGQQMENVRLEQREDKAIKEINKLDKAIDSLKGKVKKLKKGVNIILLNSRFKKM